MKINKLKVKLLTIVIITIFSSCAVDSINENSNVIYENLHYKINSLNSDNKELSNTVSIIKDNPKNKYQNDIIKSYNNSKIFRTDIHNKNIHILTQEIIESTKPLKGFIKKSTLVKILDNDINLYKIFIFRESTKEKILIEEIVDPFSGNIISYNLLGINESQYKSLHNYQSKRTICYTSFNDCYQNLQNSIDNDPEDSAICSFLPCSAINYGVCTIAQGSGYIQNSSGYIGDSNCDAIYNSKGENIKGLPGNENEN